MLAAVRRIQNSIQVTTPAARSMALPSKYSSAGELRPPMVIHRTAPTAAESASAATVPSQIRPK